METKNNIIEAYNKGYRVKEDGTVVNKDGKELKPINQNGYLRINIRIDGKSRYFRVHRLQAYQKYGSKLFDNGICVRHLNGNPKDNSINNIEIGTHSDNMMDISKKVRLQKALHATSFVKKHNHEEIKEYYNIVKSYKLVMNKFNISSKGTLSHIINK